MGHLQGTRVSSVGTKVTSFKPDREGQVSPRMSYGLARLAIAKQEGTPWRKRTPLSL